MPRIETKSTSRRLDAENRLHGHQLIRANDGYYGVLKDLSVWFEPDDGEVERVAEKDYPQEVLDLLVPHAAATATARRIQHWREIAEENAPWIYLMDVGSTKEIFSDQCLPVIKKGIAIGQTSLHLRLVVRHPGERPPTQKDIDDFKLYLKEYGCAVETGSMGTGPNGIHYIPIIISF